VCVCVHIYIYIYIHTHRYVFDIDFCIPLHAVAYPGILLGGGGVKKIQFGKERGGKGGWGRGAPAPLVERGAVFLGGGGGVKRPGSGVDHPPPSSAEVKERVELCIYSPFGPSWPVLG